MSNFLGRKWQYQLGLLGGLFCLLPIAQTDATNSPKQVEQVYVLRSLVNTDRDSIHILDDNGLDKVLLFTDKTQAESFSKQIKVPNFPPFQPTPIDRSTINQFCQQSRSICELVTTNHQLAQRTLVTQTSTEDSTPNLTGKERPVDSPTTPTPTGKDRPVDSPTPTPTPTVSPTPTSPSLTETQLNLLSKAAGRFWQNNRYETTSKMLLTGTFGGMEIKTEVQVKTIAETGNKYRSDITFRREDGKIGPRYQLISNGSQAWIYRPDLKQYSQITTAGFNDSFWIGISSSLFLSLPENLRRSLLSEVGSNGKAFAELQGLDPKQFKVENRQLNGQDFTTYIYTDTKEGFTMIGYVDPNTGNLQQVELSGDFEGINILMSENIQQRNHFTKVNRQTFNFVPPRGVKKVKKLEIEPF